MCGSPAWCIAYLHVKHRVVVRLSTQDVVDIPQRGTHVAVQNLETTHADGKSKIGSSDQAHNTCIPSAEISSAQRCCCV